MHPDITVLRFFAGQPHWLLPLAMGLTSIGSFGGVWLLLGAALLLRRGDGRRLGVTILLALLLVLLVVDLVLKPLVGRPRPFLVLGRAILLGPVPGGASFPSGHSAAAFAGAGTWGGQGRRGTILGYVYAAAVGWSRLYLGAHWPSDVVAGAVIGILLASLARFLAARFMPGESQSGGAV